METLPIKEQTAISLRRYFYEYVVIALVLAVCSLAWQYNSLNSYIRDFQAKQSIEQVRAIERNTDALNTLIIQSHSNINR